MRTFDSWPIPSDVPFRSSISRSSSPFRMHLLESRCHTVPKAGIVVAWGMVTGSAGRRLVCCALLPQPSGRPGTGEKRPRAYQVIPEAQTVPPGNVLSPFGVIVESQSIPREACGRPNPWPIDWAPGGLICARLPVRGTQSTTEAPVRGFEKLGGLMCFALCRAAGRAFQCGVRGVRRQ